MLEGLLASFLNRFLGEYIEDFDAKQLNVGVWNGSITLRDLTLKPNALRRFGLPIGVQYGIVRKLDVTIPWSNLRNKPVEIHISGIQALGSSNTTIAKREPELEDSNVLLEHKRNELEYWEASRLSSNSEQNDPKAQSMTESLLTRMVNNIQVTIEDIHIRYENDGARAKLPKGFAFGICISQFSVVSCNDNWVPIFIEQDLNIIHKLCSLESFCIYYNEFSVNSNTHVDDYSVYLNETKTNGIEYIVSPVNGTARLVLNKDPTSEAPKTTVDLIFDALNLTLYDQQYSELLETWNDVSLFLIARKHAAERPQQSYSDNPTVWLRYAFLHELRLVRQRRKAATWPAIKAFCERRRSYLELFEKRFLESLTPEESAAIDELELFFSVSDIKLFRTLVYQKIKREGIKPKPKPAETQQGWTSWLWNSLKSDTATEEIDLAEKQRIVDAIGFDEQTIRETDNEESSSRAKCKVKIALKAGKFSLFERVNDVDILSVRFVNLESQHEYTPLAYEGDIQLGDLLVLNDKRKLLFLRDQKAANSIEPQPLLKMNMSVAFNDSSPTDSLSMGLQALEFYYDYATAAQVQKFFSQPSETQKQVRAFMKYAGNAVNGITTQTTQALRRYLQDRRKFILDLNLHAPVIYLPETEGSQVTNLLCIDAGKLTINSSTPNYAQEEQEDPNELPTELFYECYKLSVENAQLLLGPSDILKTSDVNLKKKYALIENITTHFNVKALSVFSKDLPRYVFEGELEKLNLFMSDSQYRSLMRIQDCMTASTEHFEDASSVTDDDQSSSFYFQPEDDDRDFEQGPLLELSFQASALSLVLQKEIQDKSFIPMIEINVGTGRMSLKKTDEQMYFQLLVQRIGILDRATETVGQGTPKILDCSGTSEENEWPIEFTANFQHGVDNGNQNVNTYTFSCERGVLKLAKLPLFSMAEYFAVFSTDDDETKETIINDSDIQSITNLNTHFKSISFSIMDDYLSAPVEFNLSDAKMQFNSKTGSMGVILHLQDMNVVSHKKGLTDHLSLLKTNGDSLVDLTCEYRFASAANSYVPTCDFTLQSGTCSVLYDEESIKRLLLIFSDIIQTKAVIDSARYLAANGSYQVEQGTIFNLSLDVEKPVMLLPVPLRDDCNAILELSPGNLSIKTSSWLPSLSLELVFDSMSAHTYVDVNNQVTNHQTVLNDLNFRVQLKVDQYDQGKKNFYRISVLSNLNKFCVSVSEFQYVILLKFLSTSTQFLTLFDSFRSNIDAESLSKALYNETYNPETLKNTIEHLTLSTSIEVFFSFLADSIGIKLLRGGFKPNDLTPLTDITFDNVSLKSLYEDTKGTDAFLSLSSIRIQDIRDPTSELADIVLIEEESSSHFDARFSLENGSHVGVLSASLEKTRYILSLDYFIALYKYLQIPPEYSSANDGNPEIVNTSRKTPAENPKQDGLTMHYNFDILDTNVLLLSDISDKNSQVLLLNVEHTTLIKQNSYSVIVKNIGLSMSQLNNLKSDGITLVDDFSLCFGMEIGSTTNGSLDIDPLTLRLSVYDIVLLKRLFYSATELLQQNGIISSSDVKELEEEKLKEVLTHGTEASSFSGLRARSEELTFTSGGSQLLLISDSHNLPIASFSVDPFNLSLKNWSTSPRFKVLLGFDCRVFNFAKSHWEPFLEHWNILLTLRKNDGDFVLNAVSDDVAEVSVTSKLLESVRYVKKFYEENKNKSVIKRSEGYPYEILNLTGFDVELSRSTDGEDKVVVQNGKSIPWRFEKHKREQGSTKLDEKESDVRLTISFKEVWFPVREVSVHREGTFLFELKPQLETETFLMVNVQLLENSVKRITISSPYIIRNHTSTPFELVFHSSKGHKRSDIYTIEANSYLALPLDLANVYQFRLRPSANRGYVWCHKPVNWMEFLETPLSMFTCVSETSGDKYRFLLHARNLSTLKYSSRMTYPFLQLNIIPPLVIQNLLPYNCKIKVLETMSEHSISFAADLKTGLELPVYLIDIRKRLILSLEIPEIGLVPIEYPVIHSPPDYANELDRYFLLRSEKDNSSLCVELNYETVPGTEYIYKVNIFSPYIIYNTLTFPVTIASGSGVSEVVVNPTKSGSPKPCFFSFRKKSRNNRARLRVANFSRSEYFSLDVANRAIEVVLPNYKTQQFCLLGLFIEECTGKFCISKSVSISPRFLFKNNLGRIVRIREFAYKDMLVLEHGEVRPYLYFHGEIHNLVLSFQGYSNDWSSSFSIQELGCTHMKVPCGEGNYRLVRVTAELDKATILISLDDESGSWPFTLRNDTPYSLSFNQTIPAGSGLSSTINRLNSHESVGYAWDYPIVKKKRLRFSLDRDFIDVDLSAIGDLTTWKLPNDNLRFRVEMHGITPTLLITNRKPLNTQVPAFDERSRKSRPGEEHTSVTNKSSNGNSFALSVKLFGVGISLINPYYEELAYFTLRDFSLLISSSVNVCDTVVSLGWLQVDNQMNGARFPVILAPKPVTVPDNGESSDFLNLQLSILKSPSYGVTYIRHAGIYMRECTLSLEEAFLAAFSRFLAASPANNSTAIDTGSFETSLPSQNFNDTVEPSNLFIEVLDFCTFKLSVSFATASNEEDNYIGSSKTTSEVLITLFSRFLGNISNAPLVLNAMELQNARVSAGELGNRVQTYYKQQMVSKFPKMLGYSDAFGNPLGLFNTFASTISDADTLYNGDRVVRKAVSGFTDSVSKWTGNLSKNISVYTQKKSDKRSQRKVNLDDVQAPRKDVTPSRFFKRLGGNIVNLGSKPVVGFLDLASNAFGAVRDTAKLDDGEVRPVRYTRYIDYLGLVKSYSRRDAYGQHLLRVCERGAYASDHYLYHAVLPRKELLFFTLEHVLLLDPGSWTFHVICRINEIRRDVVKPGMIEVVCRNEIIKRVPLPTTEQEAGNCVVALHTAIKECQRMRARPPVL